MAYNCHPFQKSIDTPRETHCVKCDKESCEHCLPPGERIECTLQENNPPLPENNPPKRRKTTEVNVTEEVDDKGTKEGRKGKGKGKEKVKVVPYNTGTRTTRKNR